MRNLLAAVPPSFYTPPGRPRRPYTAHRQWQFKADERSEARTARVEREPSPCWASASSTDVYHRWRCVRPTSGNAAGYLLRRIAGGAAIWNANTHCAAIHASQRQCHPTTSRIMSDWYGWRALRRRPIRIALQMMKISKSCTPHDTSSRIIHSQWENDVRSVIFSAAIH